MSEPRHRVFVSAAELADARFFELTHPRTSLPIQVARAASGALLEVNKFWEGDAEPRSWFLSGGIERVEQEGSLFVATPVDPLFLLIPHLSRARGAVTDDSPKGYYKPLGDISPGAVGGEGHDPLELAVLTLPDVVSRLRSICEVNDKYDEPMVRLSDEKLLAW